MYNTRQKQCREENQKPRKTHENYNMPSFSSTLLDEIYRSIDGKTEDFNTYKEKPAKKQTDERFIRRACLVEKWMEYEENEKKVEAKRAQLLQDNHDLLFFSSTSSSSDSSGTLSSSDTEFFGSKPKPKVVSCFSTRPKPVRTGPVRLDGYQDSCCKNKMDGDDLIKSKSRALKIYANLKKVKQPISPGGRLTSFINSLFNNGNSKKSKNVETNKGFQDLRSPNAALSSTRSSAPSFSRSCLSKYSPKSREKIGANEVQRTVRFHPRVNVIVDEDCDKNVRKHSHALDVQNVLKGYNSQRIIDEISIYKKNRDEDEDGMSDSSSDLFELDHHLALFGSNRFCEELPVYETTHFETNRAIASGLIR